MDEFKPQDELKPDASDRHPVHPKKSIANVAISRQQIIMGAAVLILLLLVFMIASTFTGSENRPAESKTASQSMVNSTVTSDSTGKPGLSSANNQSNGAPQSLTDAGSHDVSSASDAPEELSVPPISSAPTVAEQQPVPESQHRIELSGDLNSALSNQQNQVDNVAEGAQEQVNSDLPTAPATVRPQADVPSKDSTHSARQSGITTPEHTQPVKTDSMHGKAGASGVQHSGHNKAVSLPKSGYTLQLSGASHSDSLTSWAKKQKLSNYHIYETRRGNKPWYVLVSGSYATSAEAKQAIAALPPDVRAQNPWVKPLRQVRKEAK